MAELRWILLGFGLLVIGGIWLWGRRRPAAGADDVAAVVRGQDRYEALADGTPSMSAQPDAAAAGHESTTEVPVRACVERQVAGANPPVVTIDDLPENAEDVVLIDAGAPVAPAVVHAEPLRAPAAASTLHVASPSPEAAPVTTAILP